MCKLLSMDDFLGDPNITKLKDGLEDLFIISDEICDDFGKDKKLYYKHLLYLFHNYFDSLNAKAFEKGYNKMAEYKKLCLKIYKDNDSMKRHYLYPYINPVLEGRPSNLSYDCFGSYDCVKLIDIFLDNAYEAFITDDHIDWLRTNSLNVSNT